MATAGPEDPGAARHRALGHPFAESLGLQPVTVRAGHSVYELQAAPGHLNPHAVVHGAVLYAMADTGMGAALYPTLQPGEMCATIQITMNYFKPVVQGSVTCTTELVNRGRRVANLHSRLTVDGALVASADGNYAIFSPGVR